MATKTNNNSNNMLEIVCYSDAEFLDVTMTIFASETTYFIKEKDFACQLKQFKKQYKHDRTINMNATIRKWLKTNITAYLDALNDHITEIAAEANADAADIRKQFRAKATQIFEKELGVKLS